MTKKITSICLIFIAVLLSCDKIDTKTTEVNYGYDFWPGKNGTVKSNIEFPEPLIMEYGLVLTPGSTGSSFFYKLPLKTNDNLKKGRLQVTVYATVEESQLGLIEYLGLLTTLSKPPRLTDKDLIAGDVAFGYIYDGIFKLAFVRNNVLAIVEAPTEAANAISVAIDEKIRIAPEWQAGSTSPYFNLQ